MDDKYLRKINFALLELLKCSVTGDKASPTISGLSHTGWKYLLDAAQVQGVLSLLYDAAKRADAPEFAIEKIRGAALGTARSNYRLWAKTLEIVRILKEEGMDSIVLKGPVTAAFYPIPEVRRAGDMDILIHEFDMERAIKVLEGMGYHRDRESSVIHEEAMYSPEGYCAELHRRMTEEMPSPKMEHVMAFCLEKGFDTGRYVTTVTKSSFPSFRDDFHAYYLLLHMLNHFMGKGFGLKLLMDWTYFFRRDIPSRTKTRIKILIDRSRLTGFAATVTRICIDYLGLEEERADFLTEGKKIPPEAADSFLDDILSGGEFGDNEEGRMMATEGRGPVALWKGFHREMKRHYPEESKNVLRWPFLWAMTLYSFEKNNRQMQRNAGIFSVIRNAGKRSAYVKAMGLFE